MLRLCTYLIFQVIIAVFSSAQLPSNGLIAHYPFCGNAADHSGNGHHALKLNNVAPAVDRFGNPNNAYSFNGTNSYISLPATPLATLNIYSYSFWLKPQADAGLVVCIGQNGGYHCQGVTYQSGGTIFGGSYNQGSNPIQSWVTSLPYALNQWIHVVVKGYVGD